MSLDETVHHKDSGVLNNELSNLEVIDRKVHCKEHAIKYPEYEKVKCVYCKKEFKLNRKQQINRNSNFIRGKAINGPFCSKQCSGKFQYSKRAFKW